MAIMLASASAVRAALLRNIGLEVLAVAHGVDETALLSGHKGDAASAALRLAVAKAEGAARRASDQVVVAADQTVAFAGAVLEKPRSVAEARERLWRMRGRSHQLETAAVIRRRERVIVAHRSVTVRLRNFDAATLDDYLQGAGAAATRSSTGYEIEGAGGRLIAAVEGDYFSALGLPLFDVVSAIEALEAQKA